MPPSTMQSFDQSPAGAFIESQAGARGFASGAGDIIFTGRFTSFGGVTHNGIAVWRAAMDAYDADGDWGLTGGTIYSKAMVVGPTLYLASAGAVVRCNKPGTTTIFSGSTVRDLCVWNGELVIATNVGIYRYNGVTATQIADDAIFAGYDVRYATCHSVVVGGSEVIAVWCYTSDPGGTGEVYVRAGYYDGSSWVWDEAWAGSSAAEGAMIVLASNAANFKRAALVDGKLYWFPYGLQALSDSAHTQGTNRHCDVLAYDPATNTTEGWCVPASAFANEIAKFTNSNGAATLGSVGGKLVVAGNNTHFDPKGASPNAAINRTVGLTPVPFSTGVGVEDAGGFLAAASTIYEPQGDRIFAGIEGTGTGVVSQIGGAAVDGGAGLRLVTFDGANWASWPEQPNSGVLSIYQAASLTI